MNSLLQQFFNINFIREGLLASPDNSLITIDESYLYQLKNIFAFLKASDKKYHNPKDFTNIFKNYDNQIMNVTEQMDVDEFYNLLIDRLEPYLKNTKYENLFKYVFSGIISNEIIGKNGCPHFSETKEFFQSIILQVKNKKNIEESLDAFIQGEMMEGDNSYNCERCEKKVSALKRQSFKKLPRVLVLVLKRFEYDYDTMQKNKINDYCEFPLELNMEKYTQEYLMKNNNEKHNDEGENPDTLNNVLNNEYQYDLTGVIIHTGTTERGHYYSFTKKDNSQWLEFNDTNVSPFNIEDLEDEAFGGSQYYFNNKTGKNELVEKSTNAYVLFYTRKDVIIIQDELKNSMDIDFPNNLAKFIQIDKETENFVSILKENSKYSNIQSDIIDNIKTDNFQYWVSKMIFSNEYIDFIKDILFNYNSQLSEIYNLNLLSRNEYNSIEPQDLIKIYENKLKEIYEKDKNQTININKSSNYFNNQDNLLQKNNVISNSSIKSNEMLNYNTRNTVLNINSGSHTKIEKYIYENVRIHRFRKIYNITDSSNQELKTNNLDIYYKKLADIYAFDSNINKNFLISNIKRNKKLFSLSFKNIKTLSPPRTNPLQDSENNFNLIPDESEIQLPLENTYESSNLKNKSINKHNSYVNDLLNTYKKDELKFDLFKFASIFFFTTILRCKEKNLIAPFVDFMKTHINLNLNNAVWLIEEFSNFELIQEFLIDCPPPEIKRITSGILYTAILKICKNKTPKEIKNNSQNEYIIIDRSDLVENSQTISNIIASENDIETVYNFIACLINLVSKKNKFPFKDFNTIYFIIWRFSTIGLEQKQFLYNYGLVKFIIAHLKLRNKFDCNINLEDCFTFNLRVPKNNEIVNKKPPKTEKLSVLEELIEKKQMEKINLLSDHYLLITLFEILSSSNYSSKLNSNQNAVENKEVVMEIEKERFISNQEEKIINLSEEIIKLISFEDKDHLRMYAFEASKTRQGSVYFNNLINKFSFNNEEFSNRLYESFFELFSNLDFDELACLIRPFRSFISLNDDLADIRVIFLNLYFYYKDFFIL